MTGNSTFNGIFAYEPPKVETCDGCNDPLTKMDRNATFIEYSVTLTAQSNHNEDQYQSNYYKQTKAMKERLQQEEETTNVHQG